jgi:hypothetical protein
MVDHLMTATIVRGNFDNEEIFIRGRIDRSGSMMDTHHQITVVIVNNEIVIVNNEIVIVNNEIVIRGRIDRWGSMMATHHQITVVIVNVEVVIRGRIDRWRLQIPISDNMAGVEGDEIAVIEIDRNAYREIR